MHLTAPDISAFLPDSLPGWQCTEKARWFDNRNLYGYIDGGAELYLSYGFVGGVHREFTKDPGTGIYADIFDMGNSKNAFGVFSHSRDTVENDFGQGSQNYGDALIFWKDRYYISVTSRGNDPGMKQAILNLAGMIDKAIHSLGEIPAITKLLPGKNLDPASVMWFNHSIWQNTYCYLSDENVLHIDTACDAVLAKYNLGGNHVCALIVQYNSQDKAQVNFGEFCNKTGLNTDHEGKDDYGKRILAGMKDSCIVVVFNCPDIPSARELLEDIKGSL